MNILIVESDKMLGELIQQYLSYRSISNQLVQNYMEAMLMIKPNYYDCILLVSH
jgi:DNA-binding response OmpR family regulator